MQSAQARPVSAERDDQRLRVRRVSPLAQPVRRAWLELQAQLLSWESKFRRAGKAWSGWS